jgi:hypothetical protein
LTSVDDAGLWWTLALPRWMKRIVGRNVLDMRMSEDGGGIEAENMSENMSGVRQFLN